jgi:hypothetical protein
LADEAVSYSVIHTLQEDDLRRFPLSADTASSGATRADDPICLIIIISTGPCESCLAAAASGSGSAVTLTASLTGRGMRAGLSPPE